MNPLPSADLDRTAAREPSVDPSATVDASADSTRPKLPPPPPGAPSIPGYAITGEIAKGGMGRVYAGVDLTLDREVAIKTLLPGANAERFETEAKITAKLPHPNIPPVHALGTLADGTPFLAMKLIRGQTLSEQLKTRSSPSHDFPRFVQVFEQIAHAVGFAHSRGVIHRDLKPLNVMVGQFGEVQVMDWGLAKEQASGGRQPPGSEAHQGADAPRSPDLTATGAVMGTPGYMAPEQARGEAVDARADVFALGSVLAAILTGKPAFVGATAKESVQKAATADLSDVLARLDSCGADADLIALAKRCLSADRDARPTDGRAVATEVGAYRAGVEARLRKAETDRAAAVVREGEQRKRRRVWGIAAAVGAVSLAAAVAAVAFWVMYQNAEWLRGLAVVAQGEAVAAQAVAEGERKKADEARDAAEGERKKTELLKATIESYDYGRTIQQAHQAWREGNLLKARALLADTKPELRGWEYRFVHRLCNAELISFRPYAAYQSLYGAGYNSDGTLLVTGGFNNQKPGTIRVWDAKTGEERLVLKVVASMRSVAFSPDDSRIVGLNDGSRTVHVWDAKTGDELVVMKGVNGVFHPMDFAVFSPDGSRIVTGSWDNTARVYDAKTGKALFPLKGHTKPVKMAAFNTDGSRIVTASEDKTSKVWDAKTGELLSTLTGRAGLGGLAVFTPDGKRIVTAGNAEGGIWNDTVVVWDADTGKELLTAKVDGLSFGCLAHDKDGMRFVTGGSDGTARVHDAKTGAELLTLKGHTSDLKTVAFSPDGTRILTASGDGTVKVWDASTGAEYRPVGHVSAIFPASFSPDGSRFVARGMDERVVVCDTVTGGLVYKLAGHATRKEGDFFGTGGYGLNPASYSGDGSRIVTSGGDKSVRVWDAKTGDLLHTLTLPGEWGQKAWPNADGSRIVSVSEGKSVKVWDTKAGTVLFTLTIPTDDPKKPSGVSFAAFAPDGKRLVTVGGHIRVWDATTGEEVLAVEQKSASGVGSVSFNSDGTHMLTTGDDQTAKVWEVGTGKLLLTLKGHTGKMNSASFHPDGTRIVTTAGDVTAKVWDAKTGAELLTLTVPREGFSSAVFSPGDGSRILTASNFNGLLKMWDSRPVVESVKERDAAKSGRKE